MRPPHFFDFGTEEICADKAPNIDFTSLDIILFTKKLVCCVSSELLAVLVTHS